MIRTGSNFFSGAKRTDTDGKFFSKSDGTRPNLELVFILFFCFFFFRERMYEGVDRGILLLRGMEIILI